MGIGLEVERQRHRGRLTDRYVSLKDRQRQTQTQTDSDNETEADTNTGQGVCNHGEHGELCQNHLKSVIREVQI